MKRKPRPDTALPLDPDTLPALRAAVVAWFGEHGRDYPWRRSHDPYTVLVSEIMLQQTQIATVLGRGYFARWLETFPDLASLAAAPEDRLLKAWEGLGYYSRARNLQRTARAIIDTHGGRFPSDLPDLLALPGIGRYTAGAIRSFAFDLPAAIVDGNIARVLARLTAWDGEINSPAGLRTLWAWAETLTDPRHPRRFNSGLMEIGQRLCTPRTARCPDCPLLPFCASAGPDATALPRRRPARATVLVTEHCLLAIRRGRLLLARESGTRRRGLWRLPLRPPEAVANLPRLDTITAAVTHHRITVHLHKAPASTAPEPGEEWVAIPDVAELPFSGPLRRLLDQHLHQNAANNQGTP